MGMQELIELLQAHLGEDLTTGQIAEIRGRLADSDELQEAVLAELSLERGLAADVSPAVTSFDDVIARIDALAAGRRHGEAGRRRKRRRNLALAGVLAIALAAAVLLVVSPHRREPGSTPAAVATSRPGHPAGGAAGGRRPATAPATRSADGSLAGRDKPPKATGGTKGSALATGSRMTWQEYVLPGTKEAAGWQGHVGKLFQRRTGKDAALSGDRRYLDLDGTYRLGAVPSSGRMLRLGVREGQQCALEFWNGGHGVRLRIDPRQGRIGADVLTRRDSRSPPAIAESFDDRGAWQWYGCGAIDLRYQNARILVCRGEVPLLRAAMPGPPREGDLTGSRVRLWLAEVRDCRPLALPAGRRHGASHGAAASPAEPAAAGLCPGEAGRIDRTSVAGTMAGDLTWQKRAGDKTKLSIGQDGVVALSADQDRSVGRAWLGLNAPELTGLEATLHVRRCTPSAGISVRAGASSRQIRVLSHGSKRVVGSGDRRTMDEDLRAGRTVGEEFWVRIRCGLDVILVWVSPDGRTWWPRRHQPVQSPSGQIEIGLEIARDKGPRSVAVGEVGIRRFESIRRMVNPEAALVARAVSALTDKVLSADSREQALAMLEEARGEDVGPAGQGDAAAGPDEWRTACDVILAGRSRHWQVRREAMRELFLAPCRPGTDADVEAVLAAVEELLEITGSARGELPQLLHEIFDGLGRYCLEAGKRKALKTVMDASYVRPGSAGLPGASPSRGVSPGLLRTVLLDHIAREEWESVRLEAMRALFIACGRDGRDWPPLARWAAAEARARLDKPPGADAADAPPADLHPLIADDDREMLKIVGEFLVLVRGEHYESACKIITSRTLPDALVSLGGEKGLLQSSHLKVREVIRATPPLRKALRQHCSEIGRIRLERARRQNDLATLRSLAAQFYGTDPGFDAMHVLADRDLSSGDFRSAAGLYELLQAAEDYPRRRDAAAKFRLASAMLGRLAGRPAAPGVVLPGGTSSPEEFERIVHRLAAEHKPGAEASEAGPGSARAKLGPARPGPGHAEARLTHLADVPGKGTASRHAQGLPTAFAVAGEVLIVSHAGTLFAVDWRSAKMLWSLEPDPKRRDRSRRAGDKDTAGLLRIGERVYVRLGLEGRPLGCFEAGTGKRLWTGQYGDRVLSDPVLTGPWVSVITAGPDASGALHVHRICPDTGESSRVRELVRVRDKWPSVGRPVVVGDAMLFRAAGCLVNCDLRGAARWARRLPFVPANVLPELHTAAALNDPIVWRDSNVIFSTPGCPYVTCVAVESGQVLWSFLIRSPARLVGLAGDSVVLVEPDRICALDPATGTVRWQRRGSMDGVGVLPAAKDTLLLVRLERQRSRRKDTPPRGRYIRWLSARSGRTVKELRIEGDWEVYGVSTLFSDGERVFGMANCEAGRSGRGKVFMVECGASAVRTTRAE